GFDVVIPQRRTRGKECWTRGLIATVGYKVIKLVADVDIPENCGEFRLLSQRVVKQVVGFKERHGFLRGLVALVGFKQCIIPFDRSDRVSGRTKYSELTGSLRVGFNGIFCFSTYALTLSTKLGFLIAIGAFILAVIYVVLKLLSFPFPLGNPSLAILILFLGGIQLLSVGVLGEYIGRIYDEVRERPKFIIDKEVGF
ncbi:MAG: glycosyltransferase, partial [Methylococcaceae bacterium]|nr:glycosyltransferase [Methylococcaceae bacterium]